MTHENSTVDPIAESDSLSSWIRTHEDELQKLARSDYPASWVAREWLESEGIPVDPDGPTPDTTPTQVGLRGV